MAVFAAYPALSSPDSAPSGPWPAQPARPAHEPRGAESVIFDVLGPCFGPQRVGAAGAGAPDLARGARTHRTPFPRRLRAVIGILGGLDPRTRPERPLGAQYPRVYPWSVEPPKTAENRPLITRIFPLAVWLRGSNQRYRTIVPDVPEGVTFRHFRFFAILPVFGPPDPGRGPILPRNPRKWPQNPRFRPVFGSNSRGHVS